MKLLQTQTDLLTIQKLIRDLLIKGFDQLQKNAFLVHLVQMKIFYVTIAQTEMKNFLSLGPTLFYQHDLNQQAKCFCHFIHHFLNNAIN